MASISKAEILANHKAFENKEARKEIITANIFKEISRKCINGPHSSTQSEKMCSSFDKLSRLKIQNVQQVLSQQSEQLEFMKKGTQISHTSEKIIMKN